MLEKIAIRTSLNTACGFSVVGGKCSELRNERDAAPSELRFYNRLKLGIAAQLRSLMELLEKRASESRFHRGEALMRKLAEDRFTLAVVGQFKRGKSSLMNAIIGRELLPVGVLPLTSAVTILKFGPVERLVVQREGMQFPEVFPVGDLADFVTECGNPSNRKRVKTATIETPLPFLRRGLEFVDTPGVGSSIEANTATTHAFLPGCDAALFVTSIDAPINSVEVEFLHTVRVHAWKIFYILNKTDLCGDEEERRELVDFVSRKIRKETASENVRVFPVSARLALRAKTHPDEGAADNGLEALEEALSAFLSHEKAPVFLAAIIERALCLLDEESGEVELFAKARTLPAETRRQRLGMIHHRFGELAGERHELLAQLRANLGRSARQALAPGLDAFLKKRRRLTVRYLQRMAARAGWQLSADLATRCGERILKSTRAKTDVWLREQLERIELGGNEAVSAAWLKLVANVGELSRFAFEAFDIPPQPPGDVVSAWLAAPVIKSSRRRGFEWSPRSVLMFLPARIAGKLLLGALRSEAERLFTDVREYAATIIEATAAAAVEMFEIEVSACATETEARIVAAINGTRLPRRMPSQGMEPPEMAGWGEGMLKNLRNNLAALREQVRHMEAADQTDALPLVKFEAPSGIKPPTLRETEISMGRRLATRGCPVCVHLADIAFNFFAKKQYALHLDESVQAEIAAARGFCPLHLWQLHAISSPLSASVGLARLVEETSRAVSQARDESDLRKLMLDANSCSVCAWLCKEERVFIKKLALFLQESEHCGDYARSQGVCLRHLVPLIAAASNEDIIRFLLAEAARHLEETAEDMQSYAMKRSAVRGPVTNADENDASWRAMVYLAGSKNVCATWPADGEI